MISRETDYAIRVVSYLSKREAKEMSFPTSLMSKELDIPYQFLRAIVKKLTHAGLVISKKGKNGGLRLACSASEISLFDVISAVNYSGICLNQCVRDKNECDRTEFCTVYKALTRIQKNLNENLQEVSFDKL